jgi:hypothetical protein
MRGELAFERTRSMLADAGLTEESSSAPSDGAFGSWLIVIAGRPRLRVVWDGKEAWVLVQRELGTHGLAWRDVWIGREDSEQNPAHVLEQVRLAAASGAA